MIVDGVELEIVERAGGAPTLVLLHEGLGCVALWRGVPDALHHATGRRIVVYSRAGYGHSGPAALPRPVTYMHHEADVVLPALLDRLGVEHPVLVGHSDGASIALLYAGGGHRVAGLVVLAPHVVVEDVTVAAIAAARDAYATDDLRPRLARYHDDVEGAFRGWNDVWLSPAFRTWDITDRLGAIGSPVLAIQGDADPYGTLHQLDLLEAGVKGSVERLVLPGVGHAAHAERPAEVVEAIARFVATTARR